jgi:glycosyltransferase involved in cell wall biosynthesis
MDSLAAQSHRNWSLWISDDGSDDETVAIAKRYQSAWGKDRVHIFAGPRRGFSANFLSLVCRADIKADYFAFCDQDDIWLPDKISRALAWISGIAHTVPALYCSRTQLVDERNEPAGYSILYRRPPSFRNALVQNVASGNTMVFNGTLCGLLRQAGADVGVHFHDWWAYLVATACGGVVRYDQMPTLRYRQHAHNQIGENLGICARLKRIKLMFHGRLRGWIDGNLLALDRIVAVMPEDKRRILERFRRSREGGALLRIAGLFLSGVERQTLSGNIGLIVAAAMKKL